MGGTERTFSSFYYFCLMFLQEEKPILTTVDFSQSNKGMKRPEAYPSEDDLPKKRIRPSPSISEESSNELNRKGSVSQDENASSGPSSLKSEGDSGAVQQLVAMFGALVAQGEKAAESLEILISSISADLLAEVVMANMHHLPPECPKADEGEEDFQNTFSLSTAFPEISGMLEGPPVRLLIITKATIYKFFGRNIYRLLSDFSNVLYSFCNNRSMKRKIFLWYLQ